jgi:5-formaminoimidazole-4-carboxamide-1-beta-D-ribofuranosyl 5'-monophosphate synthetase
MLNYRKDADITIEERLQVIEKIRQGQIKVKLHGPHSYPHYFYSTIYSEGKPSRLSCC